MNASRFAIIAAAGMAFASPAWAVCEVKHGGIVDLALNGNASHVETDCASAATVATQGTAITGLQGTVTTQGAAIAGLQGVVTTHTTQIVDHDGRIVSLEANDSAQNATLAGHTTAIGALQSENAAQQTQINTATTTNNQQDTRLDGHENRITATEDKNTEQDDRLYGHDVAIGSLEGRMTGAEQAISAHSALLSQHTAQLEEHSKGLAIAMAMPDAWLSDKKRLGIFGSVGGFGDETAVGFAAIARLDETFSLNAKLGSNTDFDHVGWQVGVGAQW